MLYVLIGIIFFSALLLVLNLRLRLELSGERRLLFVGLGQTGPQIDFISKTIRLQLWGWTFTTTTFGQHKRKSKQPEPEKKEPKPKKKSKRVRSWKEMLAVTPKIIDVVGSYLIRVLRSVVIENFRGEVRGGFDSPDLTGKAFGYYHAALGTVPALAGRFSFVPDWTGASLAGSVQLSLALPLYRLIWHTLLLIIRLPLKKLISLAIGKKRGEDNV